MVTALGKYLRKLRIDNGEILRDMAKNLSVSSSFLSAVENGKKKMPESWITRLERQYSLSSNQLEELILAQLEANDTVELNIKNASAQSKNLAISFARRFDSLDDDTVKQLFSILNRETEV